MAFFSLEEHGPTEEELTTCALGIKKYADLLKAYREIELPG